MLLPSCCPLRPPARVLRSLEMRLKYFPPCFRLVAFPPLRPLRARIAESESFGIEQIIAANATIFAMFSNSYNLDSLPEALRE